MEVFPILKTVLSIVWNCIVFVFKRIFWKNASMVYINDNKKKTNESDLTMKFKLAHHKFIRVSTNSGHISVIKMHLILMKLNLKHIIRNMNNQPDLYYTGFVSVPLALYDGYKISDNFKVKLCDKAKDSNKVYEIINKRKRIANNQYKLNNCNEINLIISSSYKIQKSTIKNCFPTYELNNQLIGDLITDSYINDIYFKTRDFLDEAANVGIKKINMYVASRQPVSFVIGTAIQKRHPEIVAYEYNGTNYTWGLNFKTERIVKND